MADRTKHNVQSIVRSLVSVPLTISILGNSTPASGTFTVVQGDEVVASVARTGVGTYQVTMKDAFVSLQGAQAAIVPHGGGARTVRPDAINASAKTVDFKVLNASLVAADTPNAESDTVYLDLQFKDSSVR